MNEQQFDINVALVLKLEYQVRFLFQSGSDWSKDKTHVYQAVLRCAKLG
jgi:hypothetical protein